MIVLLSLSLCSDCVREFCFEAFRDLEADVSSERASEPSEGTVTINDKKREAMTGRIVIMIYLFISFYLFMSKG